MKKYFITVAAFLLLLEAGFAKIQHEHVHYELPEWAPRQLELLEIQVQVSPITD